MHGKSSDKKLNDSSHLVPYVNIFYPLYLNPSDIPSEVIDTSFI
jgi:hypothetical protein